MAPSRRAATAAAFSALIGLGIGSCLPSDPDVTLTRPLGRSRVLLAASPSAAPPTDVLRAFESSYRDGSLERYRELFTDDFQFWSVVFDPRDCYVPWTREIELAFASGFFVNGFDAAPPARLARLSFGGGFIVLPDPDHAASDPHGRWHKSIQTRLVLQAKFADRTGLEIRSPTRFALVRGDSAIIPQDLIDRGFSPDSTRWWIRRWEDVSIVVTPAIGPHDEDPRAPGLSAIPSSSTVTWRQLKTRYLPPCFAPHSARLGRPQR